MPSGGDDFSVIIRCRNEGLWLGHTLQSVLDFLPRSEIVIIDNMSSDNTLDIVRMFEYLADFRIMSIQHYSPGAAINVGVARASREFVLCLSAHCVLIELDPEHVRGELDAHVCVFGKQVPVYRGKRITPRYVWSHFGDERVVNMWSQIEDRPFLHNAFAFYKRSTLTRYQFDPKWYGKEDRYWARDRIDGGGVVLYDPALRCLHHWTSDGATWKGIG